MAIDLTDKQNVNPSDADFPFGDVRDKTPLVPGTKWDRSTMSDYIQFFHKMMSVAGLSYNGLLDNETNDWQFFEALQSVLPKKYMKQITSDFDGEVVTITRSEIEAAFGNVTPFYNGALGAGTTTNNKIDFQIQIWFLDAGVWTNMPITQTVGDGAIVTVNNTTGDVSVTLSLPPVSALPTRFILMG